MARSILRQLQKVPIYTLPTDAKCPICIQPYDNQTTDSGSFETAVCLPCSDKHIFGSECLVEWLISGKTCPFCRTQIALPDASDMGTEGLEPDNQFLAFSIQHTLQWDDDWYAAFWILHLQGDRAIERRWQRWQKEWIAAADQCDAGSEAGARAALSISPLGAKKALADSRQVKATAAAIQTVRFREHRLYMQFQADGADGAQLTAPPVYQLTQTQENTLFDELERRDAFRTMSRFNMFTKRDQWNILRDVGFVWDPDWEVRGNLRPGRWSRYAY